jgi:hypothetical protein
MDKLTRYREVIRKKLEDYATWMAKPNGTVRYEVVFDPAFDHFELVCAGREGHRRIHHVVFHLDIINGKVWVQYDAPDRPIAEELVAAGIPKEDIVLAGKPPEVRQYTGDGVG